MGRAAMAETQTFYQNILIDSVDRDEIAVKATKGYGTVVEIVIEGSPANVVVTLTEPRAAIALGEALIQAAQSLIQS
jgi:hypothetical protein